LTAIKERGELCKSCFYGEARQVSRAGGPLQLFWPVAGIKRAAACAGSGSGRKKDEPGSSGAVPSGKKGERVIQQSD